jgi:hypothetical protein
MASAAASPFSFVTPGRPILSNFVSPNGGKNWVLDIPMPCDQFAVSLLTPQIPHGHGFGVYWSITPYANWQFIGALTLDAPTAFFSSPWATATNPLESLDPAQVAAAAPQGIQLGISLETLVRAHGKIFALSSRSIVKSSLFPGTSQCICRLCHRRYWETCANQRPSCRRALSESTRSRLRAIW